MSTAQAVTKTTPRRLPALALIAALALAPVVGGSEQAVASTPDPCFPLSNAIPDGGGLVTPPSEAEEPTPVNGAYEIDTKAKLVWVSWATSEYNTATSGIKRADALAASYVQTEDIDLAEGGECNWLPIMGQFGDGFSGSYDGGGKEISRLTIRSEDDDQGFFGIADGGNISGVRLIEVDIEVSASNINVGGLVGQVYGSALIRNSFVSGSVSAEDEAAGGLIGVMYSPVIVEDSHSSATVSGTEYVGGLVGQNFGKITRSFATGDVRAQNEFVGGLVGRNEAGGQIEYSYAAGNVVVETNYEAGGFVGGNEGDILSSYSTGSVTGTNQGELGGFVGYLFDSGEIVQSYSTGQVIAPEGTNLVGGFAGFAGASSTLTANFWDTDTSGFATSAGEGTASVEGFSTADMKTIDIYTANSLVNDTWPIVPATGFSAPLNNASPTPNPLANPDGTSTEIWGIGSAVNSGYPFLWWQTASAFSVTGAGSSSSSSSSSSLASASPALHMDLKAKTGDVVAGAPVLMEGQGLKPGSAYSLVVRSTPVTVKSGVASPSGTFSHTVGLPAGIAPGVHTITLTGTGPGGENLVLTQSFTVASNGTFSALGSVTGQVTGGLAATGVNGPFALGATSLAALLVLVGAGLLVARRRAEALSS